MKKLLSLNFLVGFGVGILIGKLIPSILFFVIIGCLFLIAFWDRRSKLRTANELVESMKDELLVATTTLKETREAIYEQRQGEKPL